MNPNDLKLLFRSCILAVFMIFNILINSNIVSYVIAMYVSCQGPEEVAEDVYIKYSWQWEIQQ